VRSLAIVNSQSQNWSKSLFSLRENSEANRKITIYLPRSGKWSGEMNDRPGEDKRTLDFQNGVHSNRASAGCEIRLSLPSNRITPYSGPNFTKPTSTDSLSFTLLNNIYTPTLRTFYRRFRAWEASPLPVVFSCWPPVVIWLKRQLHCRVTWHCYRRRLVNSNRSARLWPFKAKLQIYAKGAVPLAILHLRRSHTITKFVYTLKTLHYTLP